MRLAEVAGRLTTVATASQRTASLVAHVTQAIGPIDILVNNAGLIRPQALEDITEHDWDEIHDVNLKSAFLVTQAVVPGMRDRQWGRIINLSSVAAQLGGVVGPHYADVALTLARNGYITGQTYNVNGGWYMS